MQDQPGGVQVKNQEQARKNSIRANRVRTGRKMLLLSKELILPVLITDGALVAVAVTQQNQTFQEGHENLQGLEKTPDHRIIVHHERNPG